MLSLYGCFCSQNHDVPISGQSFPLHEKDEMQWDLSTLIEKSPVDSILIVPGYKWNVLWFWNILCLICHDTEFFFFFNSTISEWTTPAKQSRTSFWIIVLVYFVSWMVVNLSLTAASWFGTVSRISLKLSLLFDSSDSLCPLCALFCLTVSLGGPKIWSSWF